MDEPLEILLALRRHDGSATRWLIDLLTTLEESENVCYLLDDQLRFIYCNSAWDRFADSNDAPELSGESVIGETLMTCVPHVLAGAYDRTC